MLRSKLRLKSALAVTFIFIFIAMNAASAQEARGTLGLGGVLGEPSGATLKLWLNPVNAFDASAAFSLRDDDSNVSLHLGYLRHRYNDIEVRRGLMPYYYGFGGHVRLGDRPRAGVRIALGLSYLFERDPLELFSEITPIVELTPSTVVHINYGVGIRYYPGQLN